MPHWICRIAADLDCLLSWAFDLDRIATTAGSWCGDLVRCNRVDTGMVDDCRPLAMIVLLLFGVLGLDDAIENNPSDMIRLGWNDGTERCRRTQTSFAWGGDRHGDGPPLYNLGCE